jgi:hypothetical protein
MHMIIQEYIITGGPPAPIPTINTPAIALQLCNKTSVFRVKLLNNVSNEPGDNTEGKSDHTHQTERPFQLCDILTPGNRMQTAVAHTLLIAQLCQLGIFGHSWFEGCDANQRRH